MSILEPIEVFFVVRKACRVARWSNFVENIINKKSYEPARAYGSCNFENFQNITRAHKSRNALAFIRFPILIAVVQYIKNRIRDVFYNA